MRLDIYRGTDLAATFDYGRDPVYHGDLGRRVRALVEAPRPICNPWTGEQLDYPPADRWDWWAAAILSAGLGRAGFSVVATDVPLYGTAADRPTGAAMRHEDDADADPRVAATPA